MERDGNLDFESAMGYFSNMFPTLTKQTIKDILHQTDGVIEDSLEKLLEISNCDEPPSYEEVTRNPPPFNLEPLSPPIPPSRNLKPRPIRTENSPLSTNNQSEVPPKPDLPDFLLEAELNFESNRFRQLEEDERLAKQLQRSEIFEFERVRKTPSRSRRGQRPRSPRIDDQSPTHVVITPFQAPDERHVIPPHPISLDDNDDDPNSRIGSEPDQDTTTGFGGLPVGNPHEAPNVDERSWLTNENSSRRNKLGRAKSLMTGWYKTRFKSHGGKIIQLKALQTLDSNYLIRNFELIKQN